MRRIENISWQQYFNGAVIRRDRTEHVLVAQIAGKEEVIDEWSVVGGTATLLRTATFPGGLVFPFQADDGAVFAHTSYTGTATREFYSDIVLTGL